MLYLKSFKIFEKYSLPNAVDVLSQEVIDFVCDNFDKWVSKKGLANYSEIHQYKPVSFSDDFPVDLIKINTVFVVSDRYGKFNRTGMSHFFKEESEDMDEMSSVLTKENKLELGITLKIYVSKDKRSFSYDETKNEIDDMIVHELLHSYQYYKLKSKKIVDKQSGLVLSKTVLGLFGMYFEFNITSSFLYLCYICSSKYETDAHLSQLYTKNGAYWTTYINVIKSSYEDLLNKIKSEFDKNDESVEAFYDEFMKLYKTDYFQHKGENINVNNFDELIKYLYDMTSKKKDYLIKKIDKIKSK